MELKVTFTPDLPESHPDIQVMGRGEEPSFIGKLVWGPAGNGFQEGYVLNVDPRLPEKAVLTGGTLMQIGQKIRELNFRYRKQSTYSSFGPR